MDEIIEMTKFAYREGISIIPWIVGAFLMWFIYKLYPSMLNYLDEKTKTQRESMKLEAERSEIVRNNTAAINNNTAVLENVTRERSIMFDKFGELRSDIKLYDSRIEAKIENQNRDLLAIGKSVDIVKDRIQ